MTISVNTGAKTVAQSKVTVKLPHEQDESVGMTGGASSAPVQQAHRDLARELQDTDIGPVTDSTYRKLKGAA